MILFNFGSTLVDKKKKKKKKEKKRMRQDCFFATFLKCHFSNKMRFLLQFFIFKTYKLIKYLQFRLKMSPKKKCPQFKKQTNKKNKQL